MRYFVIFGITFIIVLVLLFYNPFLGMYKNNVTIEYDFNEEGYEWEYSLVGGSLKIDKEGNNKWTFNKSKNGVSSILFTYKNEDNVKYEIEYKFRVLGSYIFWLEGNGKGLLDYPNPY